MLGKSLTDSWSFFKNHTIALSFIILPIVAPITICNAFYQYFFIGEEFIFSEQYIPMAIDFIAYPIYMIAVIFYISSRISGDKHDTTSLWKLGIKYWQPYIILSIFVSLLVLCGFALLIVPGIILLVRYAFSEFELLLNDKKPLDAMKNSWDATKQYQWVILGGYTLITLALYTPYFMISSLVEEFSISYWVLTTVFDLIISVFSVLYTIFSFRVYEFSRTNNIPET